MLWYLFGTLRRHIRRVWSSLICCRSAPKKVRLGIYRTQILPRTRRYFFSYRDQSGVLVIWCLNREKNRASQQKAANGKILLNEIILIIFSSDKLKDKRCAKPFSAKMSTAFQNEKLAVQDQTIKLVWGEIVFFFSVKVKQITFSFNKCNSFTFLCISVVIFISKVCKKSASFRNCA